MTLITSLTTFSQLTNQPHGAESFLTS